MNKSVLLGNLSYLADFGPPRFRYEHFLRNGSGALKCFIESLLLFDRIVIPTNDFMPLLLLMSAFGETEIKNLLDRDILQFARFKGFVTYVGNGGIIVAEIIAGDTKRPRWPSAPLEEAAQCAVDRLSSKIDRTSLRNLAVKSSVEFDLYSRDQNFAKVVYDQIAADPSILSASGAIDLTKLSGSDPTVVATLSVDESKNPSDDMTRALRVAQACIEAKAAETASCDDVFTSDLVGEIFQRRLDNLSSKTAAMSYTKLLELNDLPDVAEGVLRDRSLFAELMKLRNTRHGKEFRAWFHKNCRTDERATTKEYITLLKRVSLPQSLAAKTLRFFSQVGVSLAALPLSPSVGVGVGAAAGFIDTFLTERLIGGGDPKIFLDQLKTTSSK